MSCPQNPQELQKQIKYYFSQNYSLQQAEQLGESIVTYFKYHQFDEWKDIQDDIRNGYEDCCCKEILIQQLKLTNIQKKKTEYSVLKQCIEKKLMIQSDDADIKRIKNEIIIVFTSSLNQQFANRILESFTHIIEEQTFDDLESIMDDTENIEQSEIISYIIEQINDEEYDKNIISEGIHCIIHGKTDQLFKTESNSDEFASYNPDKLPIDDIINNLKERLLLQLHDESIIDKILSSFRSVIIDNFDDLTTMKEDIDEEDAANSQILQYVLSELDSFLNVNDEQTQLSTIIESIKCVVLGEENKENEEIEEKKVENGNTRNPAIITKLEASLKERLKIKFDEQTVNNITQLFHKVILEQQYEYVDIQEDIQDIENSYILQNICKNEEDRENVASIIQSIVNNNTFNITKFEYKLDEFCIDEAKKLISKLKEQYGFDEVLPSTQSCLVNAKALELFIGYPILNWLFDLYSIERANKIKTNNDNNYSVKQWFNENSYTKWIKNKYEDESPKIIECLIAAMDELVHRAAPNLKIKDTVSDIICDSLNDMVQYTLIMHHIAHKITEQMSSGDVEWAPTQIDYAIIPQAIKQRKVNSMLDLDKDRAVLCAHLPDAANDEEENKYIENQDEYRWQLGKSSNKSECQIPIWDIQTQLKEPRISYIEGVDYFVEEAKDNYHKIHQQMYQMWEQHHKGRYKRYIFIVDRRNPTNLQKAEEHQSKMNQTLNINMKWDAVKFIPPEIDGNKTYKDKIYLIIPKRYEKQEIDRIIQPMCECGTFLRETTIGQLQQNVKKLKQRIMFLLMNQLPEPTNPEQNKCFIERKNHLKKKNIEHEEIKQINCSNMDCRKIFNYNEKAWRCPSEFNAKHCTPIGYNLCNKCAKLNKDNQVNSRLFATYGRIPDEWDKLPEASLGLSKKYIVPCIVDKNDGGIGLLDSWAGYKFGFSFHLMASNNAKTYWYYRGVKKFELTDMKSLWPELFETTENGQKQKLTQDISYLVDKYRADKQLKNNNFEQFKTQIDEMKNDELCDRYQRLITFTKLCDNTLLNVELNEDDDNTILYNKTEKQIKKHIKNSQIMNVMYNEMDLITDEEHLRCCHKQNVRITNNSEWMSLFREATGHNYNIVTCHQGYYSTNECGEKYDCPIYKRFINLVEWLKVNQNGIELKEYLQKITYSKYDFDADMNHANQYHTLGNQQLICPCGHRYNCKIYNQAWKARKQQSGSYNPTTHKWVAAISKCHNAFYHSQP